MSAAGTLFGWAFGDLHREDEPGYLQALQEKALSNARQQAERHAVEVQPGTESFTVIRKGEMLVDLDTAPDTLVVRCTVHVEGPNAWKLHAEGPMNG